ncbi:hypothetical protein KRZ98_16325 [Sphingobium sp. AS12]|uniref:hypothetical protein n=1 Tax=Sphingobium sp. AS12 TaxID=2849495 RepID=UPI001C315CB8|nr:hypothetical protein [Sphingobium sp. AS12]MBV2149813.1 hypothetical protein [Sphingobium sp. AS12]
MRIVATALVGLLLSSCAADVLRLEYAGQVSTQAGALVQSAKGYVADVKARRREANIALVASDPSCSWGDVLVIDRRWRPPAGLCDLAGVPPERQERIDLRPLSQDALKTITVAIAGVAAYQAALADVLEDKPPDAKEAINSAIGSLSTASSDINRIAGEKLFDLGVLTSDRAKAVVDLIGTLVALQQTSLKVNAVRAVVAEKDSKPLLSALDDGVTKLAALQDANSASRLLFALDLAYGRERANADFVGRREWIRQIAAAADDSPGAREARIAALRSALTQLAAIDMKLRQALAGEFSKADRQRIARENRAQILGILSQVAAIFPAI